MSGTFSTGAAGEDTTGVCREGTVVTGTCGDGIVGTAVVVTGVACWPWFAHPAQKIMKSMHMASNIFTNSIVQPYRAGLKKVLVVLKVRPTKGLLSR
jgi:hypothetical protein